MKRGTGRGRGRGVRGDRRWNHHRRGRRGDRGGGVGGVLGSRRGIHRRAVERSRGAGIRRVLIDARSAAARTFGAAMEGLGDPLVRGQAVRRSGRLPGRRWTGLDNRRCGLSRGDGRRRLGCQLFGRRGLGDLSRAMMEDRGGASGGSQGQHGDRGDGSHRRTTARSIGPYQDRIADHRRFFRRRQLGKRFGRIENGGGHFGSLPRGCPRRHRERERRNRGSCHRPRQRRRAPPTLCCYRFASEPEASRFWIRTKLREPPRRIKHCRWGRHRAAGSN